MGGVMIDDRLETSNGNLDLVKTQVTPKKTQDSRVGKQGSQSNRETGRTQSPTRTHPHDPQTSNYFAVLSEVDNGNTNAERSQSQSFPIKALGAYPIDDHE
ncbi:unnamed protein product [Amaranthus hypochondriacus]